MRCPFCIQQQSPKICSDVFSIRSTPMWDIPFWCSIAHFRTHQRLAHLWFHRPWKYNDSVDQFYVITDDTSAHKKADITKEREETDLGEAWLSCYMQLSNTPFPRMTCTSLWFCEMRIIFVPCRYRRTIKCYIHLSHPVPLIESKMVTDMVIHHTQDKTEQAAPASLPQTMVSIPAEQQAPEVVGSQDRD